MLPAARVLRIYNDLRKVKDEMEDFNRTYSNSIFTGIFKNIITRINNFYDQTITSSTLSIQTPELIIVLKDTWQQERVLERESIRERIELLDTDQMYKMNLVLDTIEAGKNFTVIAED